MLFRSLHVAPLVLGLFGLPLPLDKRETTPTADFLYWMLDVSEAQEMAIMPRVPDYESLVRFNDATGELGARRAEFRKYVEGLDYTFDTPATRNFIEEGTVGVPGGASGAQEPDVRDKIDNGP